MVSYFPFPLFCRPNVHNINYRRMIPIPLTTPKSGSRLDLVGIRRYSLMSASDELIKTTVDQIEKILNTKTVVGEPTTIEGNTIIPLISIGFAFGAGAGAGKNKDVGEGEGGGGGGGGGVKPVAVVVINKDGFHIESIKSGMVSVIDKIVDKGPEMMEKMRGKKTEEK